MSITFVDRPKKQPTFGERLAQGIHGAASEGIPAIAEHLMGQKRQQQEDAAIERLTGQKVEGLSPDLKRDFVQNFMKQKQEEQKVNAQQQEKQKSLQIAANALDTLDSMIGKAGIGMLGRANLGEEARQNRGMFESTQAAILPVFKSLFPRGMTQQEFKIIMNDWIPQPGDTEAKIRGKVAGLRNLFSKPVDQISETDVMQGPETGEPEFGDVKGAGRANEIKTFGAPKVQKGTPLDEKTAMSIKKAANGNEELAKERAKKLGYTW